MAPRLIPARERKVSLWAGGSSSQIAIYPPESQYQRRDFLYRLSTAVADSDAPSAYTSLPGVTRHLLMLEGEALVCHEGRYSLTLRPYEEIDTFDGGWDTWARGKVQDFNLMCRPGCQGRLFVAKGSGPLPKDWQHLLLFCGRGEATVRCPAGNWQLQPQDALLLDEPQDVQLQLSPEARVVCAALIFDPEKTK